MDVGVDVDVGVGIACFHVRCVGTTTRALYSASSVSIGYRHVGHV